MRLPRKASVPRPSPLSWVIAGFAHHAPPPGPTADGCAFGFIPKPARPRWRLSRRSCALGWRIKGLLATCAILLGNAPFAWAQGKNETLIVAGPRTPESADLEYLPSEAVHEMRRNIYDRLLAYEMTTNDDGVRVENFDKLAGALAESWDVSADSKSITFHLRQARTRNGHVLTADDVMWTFERGWHLKAIFYWYMTQVLKISDFDAAFHKLDDRTVQIILPYPSALIARLWVNNDLGIIDSTEAKKHLSPEDPWGSRWLATHSASFAPYSIQTYINGQQVIYVANENYFRGSPKLKRILFREMPTSSSRLASLEAGAVDVAEWLLPRELALLQNIPGVNVWKVYGNYMHHIELNNVRPPFDDVRVRQAVNYLVPRDDIAKTVYYGTARPTRSPVSEIYPGFTATDFPYNYDPEKAKKLLAEAGLAHGFKTQLAYRVGDEIEEQIAVILKTSFAKVGIDLELAKMPEAVLKSRFTKQELPMFFWRDMAIVPDAAYAANLWLNSASLANYARFKDSTIDDLINHALTSTDEAERVANMQRVQHIAVKQAPWIFLFNPGYQLAARSNVRGFSWYTPNGNAWYDFSKQ
jgi:peptide/nickel transport system substrate-binding protein